MLGTSARGRASRFYPGRDECSARPYFYRLIFE
jgi:hypothetical protein